MKGITLTELLIILGVIAILVMIGLPIYQSFQPTLQLGGAIREVVADLRYIQQLAVTEQVEYCLKFFPADNKYQLLRCGSPDFLEEKTLPEEISTTTVSGFTDNQVKYNPYGAVAEQGSIILENTDNRTKTILVKASGFVEMAD
jgi:competence protein ComGD